MDERPVLRVGCAMWANRSWVGRHLPADVPAGEELAAYARLCSAVEGNTTFYAVPPATSVARWAAQAPADFRMVCKLPRAVTHDRRLRNVDELVAEFLERLEPLTDRLGPISIQLPPSFGPDDLGVLDEFLDRAPSLASAPSPVTWGVEARHPAFAARGSHEASFDAVLRAHGADRIIIDTRAVFAGPRDTPAEVEAFARKPRLGVRPVATARQPVVRFIGQTDLDANAPFWSDWIAPVVRWLEDGLEPIVFLHTPDNDDAPVLARRFHADVAGHLPIRPLPDPLPVGDQLGLFG